MFNFLDNEMTLEERQTSFFYLVSVWIVFCLVTIILVFTIFAILIPFLCLLDIYILFGIIKANEIGLTQEREERKKRKH